MDSKTPCTSPTAIGAGFCPGVGNWEGFNTHSLGAPATARIQMLATRDEQEMRFTQPLSSNSSINGVITTAGAREDSVKCATQARTAIVDLHEQVNTGPIDLSESFNDLHISSDSDDEMDSYTMRKGLRAVARSRNLRDDHQARVSMRSLKRNAKLRNAVPSACSRDDREFFAHKNAAAQGMLLGSHTRLDRQFNSLKCVDAKPVPASVWLSQKRVRTQSVRDVPRVMEDLRAGTAKFGDVLRIMPYTILEDHDLATAFVEKSSRERLQRSVAQHQNLFSLLMNPLLIAILLLIAGIEPNPGPVCVNDGDYVCGKTFPGRHGVYCILCGVQLTNVDKKHVGLHAKPDFVLDEAKSEMSGAAPSACSSGAVEPSPAARAATATISELNDRKNSPRPENMNSLAGPAPEPRFSVPSVESQPREKSVVVNGMDVSAEVISVALSLDLHVPVLGGYTSTTRFVCADTNDKDTRIPSAHLIKRTTGSLELTTISSKLTFFAFMFAFFPKIRLPQLQGIAYITVIWAFFLELIEVLVDLFIWPLRYLEFIPAFSFIIIFVHTWERFALNLPATICRKIGNMDFQQAYDIYDYVSGWPLKAVYTVLWVGEFLPLPVLPGMARRGRLWLSRLNTVSTITFSPTLVTEMLNDVSHAATPDALYTNLTLAARRHSNLPVPADMIDAVKRGSVLIAYAILLLQDFPGVGLWNQSP